MTAPVPKTKASEIKSELNELTAVASEYLDAADPRVLGWSDELETCVNASRSEAFSAMSLLAHLRGDAEQALRLLERAYTAGLSADDARSQQISMLANLGLFSQASERCQEYLDMGLDRQFGAPSPGTIALVGSFKVLAHMLQRMENAGMHSVLEQLPQIHRLRQIAAGTHESGVPDAQFAAVLDLAGAVMRERKLFWLNLEPDMWFDPEMHSVAMRFHFGCAQSVASAMSEEFLDRLIAADLDRVPMSIIFHGTQPESDALKADVAAA